MKSRLNFTDSQGWANITRYDDGEEWRKVYGDSMHRIQLVPRLENVDLPAIRVLYVLNNKWTVAYVMPFPNEAVREDFVAHLRIDFQNISAKFGYHPGEGEDFDETSRRIDAFLGAVPSWIRGYDE